MIRAPVLPNGITHAEIAGWDRSAARALERWPGLPEAALRAAGALPFAIDGTVLASRDLAVRFEHATLDDAATFVALSALQQCAPPDDDADLRAVLANLGPSRLGYSLLTDPDPRSRATAATLLRRWAVVGVC